MSLDAAARADLGRRQGGADLARCAYSGASQGGCEIGVDLSRSEASALEAL
ncbi:MAG: hypothetical protein Q8M37_11915 [Nevskia sp.]|nr:hypothetical protein [Nevskia sp.]